jgi:hypothetical protein
MSAFIMRGMGRWFGVGLQMLCVVVALTSAELCVAEPMTLSEAQATVTINGKTQRGPLSLPYHWDRIHPGQRGEATFDFQFDLPNAPAEVWGIYLPRLGNAYEIWLNGSKLQYQGNMAQSGGVDAVYNGADYARLPRYISVAGGHFGVTNHLKIRIRADVGRRGGLAPPVIGPQEQVYPLYEHAYRWRATGSIVVVALCFVFGITALALWGITKGLPQTDQAGRDALYLYAGVAQFFWAFNVAAVLVEDPPLPWPWWGVLQVLALGTWSFCMALTCMETAGLVGHPGGARGRQRSRACVPAYAQLEGHGARAGAHSRAHRILRNMHDGVGRTSVGHAQLQSDRGSRYRGSRAEVLQTLRDAHGPAQAVHRLHALAAGGHYGLVGQSCATAWSRVSAPWAWRCSGMWICCPSCKNSGR